jgi:iron complex transport system permease protein
VTAARALLPLCVLAGLAAAAASANLVVGAAAVSLGDVWAALTTRALVDPATVAIVMEIRAPRAVLALAVGAALGAAGAALQGLFRNPLADPGLIGVTSGAALAAAIWIAFMGPVAGLLAAYGLMGAAFVGGLAATLIVFAMARFAPDGGVAFMLLAGVAINALAGAGLGLVLFFADEQATRTLTFWTLGSLSGGTWASVGLTALVALAAAAGLVWLARALDLLTLGEAEAQASGLDAGRAMLAVALVSALGVAAATAVAGVIGFIGLVAPHIARALIGPGHRALIPASALLGALLVAAADLPARTLLAPAELPIGVVTSLIGAPVFCILLWRAARRFSA